MHFSGFNSTHKIILKINCILFSVYLTYIRRCSELGKRISTYRFEYMSSTRHLWSKRVTVESMSEMMKNYRGPRVAKDYGKRRAKPLLLNRKRKLRARSPRCSDGDCLLLELYTVYDFKINSAFETVNYCTFPFRKRSGIVLL